MKYALKLVPVRYFRHKLTGKKVSPYGSLPWTNQADKQNWEEITEGWTVYNPNENTYGLSYQLPKDKEEAQKVVDSLNQKELDRQNNWLKMYRPEEPLRTQLLQA